MTLSFGPPNPSLLRELRQVGEDAEAVVQALREVNLLPHQFPRAVLEDLCWSLSGLKDGTAENCRPTLEYTRGKIPQIRRENFFLEDDDAGEIEPLSDEPRLYRGMVLDRQMNILLASITTALDEYRVQAQDRFDDEVRGEEVVVLRHPEDTAASAARAADVIAATDEAREELHDRGVDQSENGEVLSRRLQDSRTLALAARSQIQSGRIVRRWFEGIATAMHRMPELIKTAGNAIQIGADDIAGPLAGWWSRFQDAALKSSIEVARDFGPTLVEISEKLKHRRGFQAVEMPQENSPRDPAVLRAEAEVERMLKAGIEIPPDLARTVEKINVGGNKYNRTKIPRWQDVGSLSSLTAFRANYTDFDPLQHGPVFANNKKLSVLSISVNDNEFLTFLSQLKTLTSLSLRANRATDLSPLQGLTDLITLSLQANSATDLTPLRRLTALKSLGLQANRATSFAELNHLVALKTLNLQSKMVTSLRPIEQLEALTSLTLHTHRVRDLTPLGSLTALNSLSLQANSARDLAALARLTALTSLTLHANYATDLTPLKGLTALSTLNLYSNSATDLTPLGGLPTLTSLMLHAFPQLT